MHIRFCAVLLLAGLLLPVSPLVPIASAAPFTPEQCTGLRQLRQELEGRGVGATVTKGAKWAAENLNAAQLGEVGAFLKLGEEIRFRCGKSTIGKQKQPALNVNIPLPARNSRRVRKDKADKAKRASTAAAASAKIGPEMSPEEKSVLSASTDTKTGASKGGTSTVRSRPAQK